jgi:hypothetical protein
MRVRKGLEVAWGQRQRGEPTGFDDIDSDSETDMSLQASIQREQAKELKSRQRVKTEGVEQRFVHIATEMVGSLGEQPDLRFAYGAIGPDLEGQM